MRNASCRILAVAMTLAGVATLALADAKLPRHSVLGAAFADSTAGPAVSQVFPNTPASRAGLTAGDVVVTIAGKAMANSAAIVSDVRQEPQGIAVPFGIVRGATKLSLAVTFDPAPDEHDPVVTTAYGVLRFENSLRRTLLTKPVGAKGRLPALLIIGGIGCFSVDVARNPEDAYLRLAHDLSRRGFVVVRVEKSGIGDSEGPPCQSVDLFTEERSYLAALKAMKREPGIDPARIYLMGHSIGTVMAPRLALQERVAGIVAADGVARNWFEYELSNLRRQLVLDGEAPAKVDALLSEKERCMHRLLIERSPEAAIEKEEPDCATHNTYPAPDAYLQEAASLNLAEAWTKIDVPVLALWGRADFITAEEDHQRIVDIVNAFHPGMAKLLTIDGMDHYFDHAGTVQQAYDLRVKEHGTAPFEPALSTAIGDWLCRHERCAPSP